MTGQLSETPHHELRTHKPLTASFRDPDGRLFVVDGRIVRIIHHACVPNFNAFMASEAAKTLAHERRLVATSFLANDEAKGLFRETEFEPLFDGTSDPGLVVEHEKVPIPAFPYEWAPEMLHEAALLTLDLAERLLAEGFGLKDASPGNVMFHGPAPMFIDLLSVERRDPSDPTWLPYAQFVRTFLLPLLVNKRFGIPLSQVLATRRDGLEPEEVYRLCGPFRKWSPPFLTLASIPTWLAARHRHDDPAIYQRKALGNPEKARFILTALFRDLRRLLHSCAPASNRNSVWSRYMTSDLHYSREQFAAKSAFVEHVLAEYHPRQVLDIGCNAGHFSVLAAKSGARVVAVDSDPVVVGTVWRTANVEGLDILPLVVDMARPSPAIGWRNQECPAFLDRTRGAFDAVLMLAVVHHLLISERIPLEDLLHLAAELTTDVLVVEFIAPDDPMFRHLARGRDALFNWLTLEVFEDACRRHFTIVRSQRLGHASRWLFLLRKRKTHRADA